MKNIITDDTRQNNQSVLKKSMLNVVMNTRIIKSLELPEIIKKTSEYLKLAYRMVEAMYEQSSQFKTKIRKYFKFFIGQGTRRLTTP